MAPERIECNLLIRSWVAALLMAGIQAFHWAPYSPKWACPVMVCSSSWIGSWMKITMLCPLWTNGDDSPFLDTPRPR